MRFKFSSWKALQIGFQNVVPRKKELSEVRFIFRFGFLGCCFPALDLDPA